MNSMNGNIQVVPYPYGGQLVDPWRDYLNPLKDYKGPEVDFRHEMEMAGTKKSSVSVKTKGGTINVQWTNRFGQLLNQPLHIGDKYYDMSKLSVTYEDGLLSIHCPLKPEFPPVPPEEPEIDIEIK